MTEKSMPDKPGPDEPGDDGQEADRRIRVDSDEQLLGRDDDRRSH